VDDVLEGGTEHLSRFRDRIEDERETMHTKFEAFKETVGNEAAGRGWFRSRGAIPLVLAIVVFAAAGGVWLTQSGWPDLVVGFALACLLLRSAASVSARALRELRADATPA